MKKLIIALVLLTPFVSFGASALIKEIKSYENIGIIQTDDSKNVKVYKVDDPADPAIKCYVAYTSGWTNGNNTNISCVKVK